MKLAYFDCFSGISGDMTVGALIDAGADIECIRAALESLGVEGFRVSAEKVKKKGVMATQFKVHLDDGVKQPHRHLRHVVEIIEGGDLSDAVKARATATFERIAVAEAAVHGSTVEKVHFHEVGAVDSIVDIIAAPLALEMLGVEEARFSPLNLGGGTVKCAHGIMPVPAPATALLVEGIPAHGDIPEAGELTTPTGAALAAECASGFGPAPMFEVTSIGYGSGEKDLDGQANVLRVRIGEAASLDETPGRDKVSVLEANVDDMTGELLPPLLEALLDAGARDAFITPLIGKKGRPAHQVTALCDPEMASEIGEVLIANSTTLGVRIHEMERMILERHFALANTEWGPVRVKIGSLSGTQNSAAPEFEDCKKLAAAHGVPVRHVYEAAIGLAYSGALDDE